MSDKQEISLYPPVPVVNVPLRLAFRTIKENKKKSDPKDDDNPLYATYTNTNHTRFVEDLKIFIDGVEINTQQPKDNKKSGSFLSSINKFFSTTSNENRQRSNSTGSNNDPFGVMDSNIIPLNEQTAIFIPRLEHAGKELAVKFNIKKKGFELKSIIQYRHEREWSKIAQDPMATDENRQSIRVMQYNVMADCYTSPVRYSECPVYALYRNYRQWILPEYILERNADIVCLQEAEVRMERLRNKMVEAGYSHSQLCDLAKYEEEQCITYYRTSRFDLIEQQLVHYSRLDQFLPESQLGPLKRASITGKYLDLLSCTMHHNKFSLLLLKDKQQSDESKSTILVGSVHLHWGSPDFEVNYIAQVVQLHIFMLIIGNLLDKNGLPRDTPLVICGDFNNGPTQKAYSLMDYGEYELNGFKLSHKFQMKSVYAQRPEGEPNFTIKTKHFTGSIDQIWMSEKLRVTDLLEIGNHYGKTLPSIVDPSDHIMMLADLYISDKPISTTTTTTTTSTDQKIENKENQNDESNQ